MLRVSVVLIIVMINLSSVLAGKGGPIRLGDYCSYDDDCTGDIDNSRCNVTNHECICEDGFFNIRDESCSHVLNDANTPCFIECDCTYYVQNTKCENYICVCDDGYKATNTTCEKDPNYTATINNAGHQSPNEHPDYTAAAKNVGNQCPCERSGVSSQFSTFSIVASHLLIFSVALFFHSIKFV